MRATLAIALALSCCLALANETPTKQNAKDRDKSQQDSHQKQELSVTLPPSIDVTVSGKVQIEGNKQETEAPKEQETFPERFWKFSLTDALLSIFTFFLCGIGFWQGLHLKRSVDELRKDFISTHRPRIKVRHVWVDGPKWASAELDITIQITNVGNTEAKIVRFSAKSRVLPRLDGDPTILGAIPRYETSKTPIEPLILRSGESFDLSPDTRQTDSDIAHVRHERSDLYCFGFIEYQDGIGRLRTTAFIRRLKLSGPPAAKAMACRMVKVENEDYEYED
jgi:hypothetical protein